MDVEIAGISQMIMATMKKRVASRHRSFMPVPGDLV